MSLANLARLALLLGLALAAAFASTVVAWKFQFARELGPPLWGHFYHPLDVLAWARAWGLSAPYRATFLAGVSTALLFLALPLLVVLRFRLRDERRVRSICVPRDSQAADLHRRLRVRLTFSRRRWAAPE